MPSGLTGNLVFAVIAGGVGSAFQHGYSIGVTNAAQPLIEKFINDTYTGRYDEVPDEKKVDLIFSVIVAIFCVGGMIGALSTAFVADKIGKKGGLLYNNVLVLVAALLFGSCTYVPSYEMLIAGRFIIGFNAGLNAGLAPMFLSEISPSNLRGSIGTIYQLVITISILISQILGLPELLGTDKLWPVLFAIIIVPAIFMVMTLPFCPESPKHILIIQNNEAGAQKALTWLRGTTDVQEEMTEMRNEVERMKQEPKVTMREMWTNPMLRQPLIIVIVMMLCQQFSGINAAIGYSTDIFRDAGLQKPVPMYCTLGMGVVNVIMTVISLVLVEKAGRRTLLLIGEAGMAVTAILLTICLSYKEEAPFLIYVSIFGVYLFVIMFATGPGSIPWFLVTEMFGMSARSKAQPIAVAVNWAANFLVALCFLHLKELLGANVFLIFAILLIMFWAYTYKRLPETKGRSVEEVTSIFRR